MVNTDDFIKRLEILMDHLGLNASSFADKIGVQRSSISHLLSGRNKPSLDFIMKIMDVFPEVNLYWILNGKGNLLKEEADFSAILQSKKNDNHTPILNNNLISEKSEVDNSEAVVLKKELPEVQSLNSNSDIFKIVFFYNDGTFKDFIAK